jgi:hypothetical protein
MTHYPNAPRIPPTCNAFAATYSNALQSRVRAIRAMNAAVIEHPKTSA